MATLAGILLVDDDSTSTFLSERLLRKLLPTTLLLSAPNGAEGLQLLQHVLTRSPESSPWLVLLDVNMPVLDGFGFLHAYQQLPPAHRQRVVVVMLTTSLHLRDLERLQPFSIAGVLPKPLTEAKVTALLPTLTAHPLPTRYGPTLRVFQLVYCSRAMRALSEDEWEKLLGKARRFNAAQQITGVLLYRAGRYVQLLEGPEAAVRRLFARLVQDPRHTQVVTVQVVAAARPYFADWSMARGPIANPAVAQLFEAALAHDPYDKVPLDEALLQAVSTTLASALA
jgi:CheY-like chemotaxis protein